MKRTNILKIISYVVIILILSCNCNTNKAKENKIFDEKEKKLINLAISDLENAYQWVIQYAIMTYYENIDGESRIIDKLHKDFYVGLYSTIAVDSYDGYLAEFTLKARGIGYYTRCYNRIIYDDFVYEYWCVEINGLPWSGVDNVFNRNYYFIIAKAENERAKREIIKKETQFFDKYVIDENKVIEFPMDMKSLYRLGAWIYPGNFKDSELKNFMVIIDPKTKEYIEVPLDYYEKMKKWWEFWK